MNIDPRQLQQMMKQMGIKTDNISAKRVIIETEEEKIILNNPSVVKMDAQGESSYQISGGSVEVKAVIPESDVDLVMKQSGASKDASLAALEETDGDVAEAIMKLKK